MKIGWSKREISISEPVSIPGQMYMRISEGVHDTLYTTVLCVEGESGQDVVFFCTCDIVVLRGDVIALTLQKVSKLRPEIPLDSVIMGATHTHAGACATDTPETSPDGKKIYPGSKYREFLTDQCAAAICEAWDTRCAGGIGYGYGYAVVAHSRRTVYLEDQGEKNLLRAAPNGFAVMYGSTKKEAFSHYEAGADHYLNLMFTFDPDQKLTGIVVNVPCPSQCSGGFTMLSADYWNEVRQLVSKEFGDSVFVLPQCAPAGDLSPRALHYSAAQARRMELKYGLHYDPKNTGAGTEDYYRKSMAERYDIAERIVEGIRDVYSWAKKEIRTDLTVRHVRKDLSLSRRLITDEEYAECQDNLEKMQSLMPSAEEMPPEEYRVTMTRYNAIKNRNNRAIERYHSQRNEPCFATTVHIAQIGDIAFATNRFELYMDYMHRIQARSPFLQTFCIQLAGDEGGSYLPTERGVRNKGYSASMFCNQVGYQGGQELVEYTLELLRELKDGNKAP